MQNALLSMFEIRELRGHGANLRSGVFSFPAREGMIAGYHGAGHGGVSSFFTSALCDGARDMGMNRQFVGALLMEAISIIITCKLS